MSIIYINTDGGARGNPGPAGIGVVFFDATGNEIYSHKEYIGRATNNQAEYKAIIKALNIIIKSKWFDKHQGKGEAKIVCRLDSQLVVEQLCGNYKVKNGNISELANEAKLLINKIQINIEFVHVKREENKIADKLVNKAIDQHLKTK